MRGVTLFILALLFSSELHAQCDVAEIGITSLKFESESSHLVRRSLLKRIQSQVKRDSIEKFIVLDFSRVVKDVDSVGVEVALNGAWDIIWHRLDDGSSWYLYEVKNGLYGKDAICVFYYNCTRIEVPVFSGSDYYLIDRTYTEQDSSGYEFSYVDLSWTILNQKKKVGDAITSSFVFELSGYMNSPDDSLDYEYIQTLPCDTIILDLDIYNFGEISRVYLEEHPDNLFDFSTKWEWNSYFDVYSGNISPIEQMENPFVIIESSKGHFRFPIIPYYCGMRIGLVEGMNKIHVTYGALRMYYLE